MRNLCLTLSLLGFLSFCSFANAWEFKPFDGWDKTDKALFATGLVFQTVDMLQTNDIYHDDDYHEVNPIIDAVVDAGGTKVLPLYFLSTAFIKYAVADNLSGEYRKAFLATTTAISVGLVVHNNSIGLGLNFNF